MSFVPLPPAQNAGLRADNDYLRLLEAESTWAFKYNQAQVNPGDPRRFPIQGLNAPHMGPSQVATYNRLLPYNYRVEHRSSRNRLETELFGRAPYIALGRGVMFHVDDSTKLAQGNPLFDRGNRVIMERPWDRRQFVTIPHDLKTLPVETRKGQITRMAPQYLQPHDP